MEEADGKEVKLIATPVENISLCNCSNTISDEVFMSLTSVTKNKLLLHNSMTRKKEFFVPKVKGKVGIYSCGITPYDDSHVGHARASIGFDVIYRYLLHSGFDVTYVRNFTDVDDKIIDKANKCGENIFTVSNHFIGKYHDEMRDLQCLDPTHEPRVTGHIEQIISMINETIRNDCAYVVDGDVYFNLDKYPNFGCLSRNSREDLLVTPDPKKREPQDFALWKASKPGEPYWDSPWGHGRPGWHIECSAMSSHYLSFQFDIHGGGSDLIFPHHENEIALSWAACQASKVGYWVHIGRVNNGDEKMSKSLGNHIPIHEITKFYHPLSLRHYLMSVHYRSPLNFFTSQLDNASEAVFYIYQTLQDCEAAVSALRGSNPEEGAESNGKTTEISGEAKNCIDRLWNDFHTKMSDDLQTTPVLGSILPESLRFINKVLDSLKGKPKQHLQLIQSLIEVEKVVKEVLSILGLLSPLSCFEVVTQLKEMALGRANMKEDDVMNLIGKRSQARKERDFSSSDRIRRDLAAKGIALMDVDKETIWRPCVPRKQEDQVLLRRCSR